MKFKITYIIVCIVGFTLLHLNSPAHAEEIWVDIYTVSVHNKDTYQDQVTGEIRKYNESNPGIGISLPMTNHLEAGFGVLKNSYANTALYTGIDIHTTSKELIGFGVAFAFSTGYVETEVGLPFILAPNISLSTKHVRAKLMIMPGKTTGASLVLGVRF